MAHLLHLSTLDRLLRSRQDHFCRSTWHAPKQGRIRRQRNELNRTGFLAAQESDQNVWRAIAEFPNDSTADAIGS